MFSILTEVIVRKYIKPNEIIEKTKFDFHFQESPYIVLADSHGANAINSNSKVLNLSIRGINLLSIRKMALHYIERNKTKGIIIQADAHQFSAYRLLSEQDHILADIIDPRDILVQFSRPIYRRYIFDYWKSILTIIEQKNAQETKTESQKIDPTFLADGTLKRVQLHTPISNVTASVHSEEYKDFLVSLAERNIEVCLVSFPLSSNYREEKKKFPEFQETMQFFISLQDLTGIHYRDLSSSMDDRFFADADHLNKLGASIFTKLVSRECFGWE